MVSSSGAMKTIHQPVFQLLHLRHSITRLTPATQATVQVLALPASNVEKKGTGQEIALLLPPILRLSSEQDLCRQGHAINVVRLDTGPGTALFLSLSKCISIWLNHLRGVFGTTFDLMISISTLGSLKVSVGK